MQNCKYVRTYQTAKLKEHTSHGSHTNTFRPSHVIIMSVQIRFVFGLFSLFQDASFHTHTPIPHSFSAMQWRRSIEPALDPKRGNWFYCSNASQQHHLLSRNTARPHIAPSFFANHTTVAHPVVPRIAPLYFHLRFVHDPPAP